MRKKAKMPQVTLWRDLETGFGDCACPQSDLFPKGGMMAVWTLHSTTGQPDESQRSVDFGQLSCARCVQTQTQQEKLYGA